MRQASLITTILFFLLTPMLCFAGLNAESALTDFLRPLSAEVIMPIENGILIDKGSVARVSPGDTFVVVSSEKKLLHPKTGQVLDILRGYGAFFEVTRVKQNLAYCKQIGGQGIPSAGTKVRRFENLPLSFEDTTGNGFALFSSLREQLPHLLWQEYQTAAKAQAVDGKPALLIRLANDRLQLLDQNGRILFAQQRLAAPVSSAPSVPVAAAAAGPVSVTTATGLVLTRKAASAKKYLRISLPKKTEAQALRVLDLDGDGDLEIILGAGESILVGRLDTAGKFVELSRSVSRSYQKIYAIAALDLDQDGRPEIAVSALADNEVVSEIYEFSNNKLTLAATSQLLLASYQPIDGKEILLGMSKSSLLSSQPRLYKISLRGGRIEKSAFVIPAARQPFGISPLTDSQGNVLQVVSTEDNHLKVVNRQGESLWTSEEYYGGSTVHFNIPQPGSRNTGDDEKIFLNTRLQGSVNGTLLVAKHADTGFFKNSPNYKNGRIVELQWSGFTLEEIGTTENLGGFVTDFDQADIDNDGDQDLVVSVVYTQGGVFTEPVSGLVVISNER